MSTHLTSSGSPEAVSSLNDDIRELLALIPEIRKQCPDVADHLTFRLLDVLKVAKLPKLPKEVLP